MAREALGIVGAAVGYVASGGNPYGAYWGFTIGYGIGGAIDPTTIKAPGVSEAPVQTSRPGVARPIIWGLHACHGNLIQKNPEEIVTTTTSQGKGGGTEVEEQRRYRTFAIRICEGPIAEVTRIWENNKLVYDARSTPAIPAAETAKYAEGITIYLGTADQLPDPDLEAHWGTDETPAYRGTAYVVWTNKDLTDTGGAIPNYLFEVNGSRDATITSKPYPIEATDGVQPTVTPAAGQDILPPIEGVLPAVVPQDGTLTSPLNEYDYEVEGIQPTLTPQNGTLAVKLEEYTYETEGVQPTVTPQDGTLEVRLVSYDYDEEGIQPTVTPKNGTLI